MGARTRGLPGADVAGGKATLKVWDGMVHSWQLYAPILEEGMQPIQEAGDFIRAQLTSRD